MKIPEINISAPIDLEPLARELGDGLRGVLDEQSRVNASVLRSAAQDRATAAEEARQEAAERETRRRDDRAQEAAELRERDERLAAALERDMPAAQVNVDMTPVAEAMADFGSLMASQKPPEIHVHPSESRSKRVSVERGANGFITGMEIEEESDG